MALLTPNGDEEGKARKAHPLLVRAGSSEDGKVLAARYAEAVFTAQQTLEDAQRFYGDARSSSTSRRASASPCVS